MASMSFEKTKKELRLLIAQRFVACFANETAMVEALRDRASLRKNREDITDSAGIINHGELDRIFEAIDNPQLSSEYGCDANRARGYFDPLGLSPDGLRTSDFLIIDAAVFHATGADYELAASALSVDEQLLALDKESFDAFLQSVYIILKPLAEEQLYLRAKKMLTATLSNQTMNKDINLVSKSIIQDIERIKQASDCPLSVEEMAAALRGINQMVLKPESLDPVPDILIELQQKMTTYNTENGKKLAASLGILLGIATILISLAFAVATVGAGTPVSIGGVSLGVLLITTAVLGSGAAALGLYQYHQINLAEPEAALKDQMDKFRSPPTPTA